MIVKYKDYYEGTVNVDLPDNTPPELLDEVLAFFKEDYRHEYNMHRRDERHELFSLDAFEYEPATPYDYSSLAYHMTPEEILLLNPGHGAPVYRHYRIVCGDHPFLRGED